MKHNEWRDRDRARKRKGERKYIIQQAACSIYELTFPFSSLFLFCCVIHSFIPSSSQEVYVLCVSALVVDCFFFWVGG
jgi:hypothetical protein